MRDYKFPSMTSGYQVRRSTRQEKDNIISTCFTLSQRSIIDSRHFSSFSLFGAAAAAGVMLKIIRQIFVFSRTPKECSSIEQSFEKRVLFINLFKITYHFLAIKILKRLSQCTNAHVELFNAVLFHYTVFYLQNSLFNCIFNNTN